MIFTSCSTEKLVQKNTTCDCLILNLKEYDYVFKIEALNQRKDTIVALSYKDNYYTKNNYRQPDLEVLEEIKAFHHYRFKMVPKKPTVSTMEQLGAFIIVEKDTLLQARSYREIPSTFVLINSRGKFFGENKKKN